MHAIVQYNVYRVCKLTYLVIFKMKAGPEKERSWNTEKIRRKQESSWKNQKGHEKRSSDFSLFSR